MGTYFELSRFKSIDVMSKHSRDIRLLNSQMSQFAGGVDLRIKDEGSSELSTPNRRAEKSFELGEDPIYIGDYRPKKNQNTTPTHLALKRNNPSFVTPQSGK